MGPRDVIGVPGLPSQSEWEKLPILKYELEVGGMESYETNLF